MQLFVRKVLTRPVKCDTISTTKGKKKEDKTMTTSRIFFDGKTNKMRTAFIIECDDTEDYIAKEEVENGTWYYDRMGSGASVAWFVPKKEVA